ncbi:MAG: acetoacetate--CoA ligase [Chloroflexales bacterium]|nr:acetoacetate--CoA ligase [Chloroflexales bacterium]
MSTVLWTPSEARRINSLLWQFMRHAYPQSNGDYHALWRWSLDRPAEFWRNVWQFTGMIGSPVGDVIVDDVTRMPGTQWFSNVIMNYAQNLLHRRDDGDAIVFWGEDQVTQRLSFAQLHDQVSLAQQSLLAAGVGVGDRVAGYLPNLPAAVIWMLAAASLGAIWSSASPDFGVSGVLDRFGQITPRVLIAVDGYYYAGVWHDCIAKLQEIVPQLPSVQRVIVVPYHGEIRGTIATIPRTVSWADAVAAFLPRECTFIQLSFAHPLFIMYSSGTTGVPKCIVHSAGGTLIQHRKEHQLQSDIHPNDRVFYFTTCGWMMWNWLVSALASGATIMLYDGNPSVRDGTILFDYIDAEQITLFGTSAKWIDACAKMKLSPINTHTLNSVRTICATGSVLVPDSFDYVYQHIKSDVQLASISGGTDIISCFMLGNPFGPVYRGEIQAPGLGMALAVFDEQGQPIYGQKGELVCTHAFPSMPIGFWGDPEGSAYQSAYFEKYPGVWCHGDWVELTPHGGIIVYGRSDATLNPGGVRIGTAEIYGQLAYVDAVLEGVVIGQDWHGDVRVVLFVRLRPGIILDDALRQVIKTRVRHHTTPRHVPAVIVQVEDIPRTKSGKIVELAVRAVVHGEPVKNREALANPEALEQFIGRV